MLNQFALSEDPNKSSSDPLQSDDSFIMNTSAETLSNSTRNDNSRESNHMDSVISSTRPCNWLPTTRPPAVVAASSDYVGDRLNLIIDKCIQTTVEKYVVDRVEKILVGPAYSSQMTGNTLIVEHPSRQSEPASAPALNLPRQSEPASASALNSSRQSASTHDRRQPNERRLLATRSIPFSDTSAKKLLLLMIMKAIEFAVYILMLNLSVASLWFVPIHFGDDWNANININYWLISGSSPAGLYLYFATITAIMLCAIYGCREHMLPKTCWTLFHVSSAAIIIAVQIVFVTCIVIYEYGRDIDIDNFFGFLIVTCCILGVAIVIFVIMSAISYCVRAPRSSRNHSRDFSYESGRGSYRESRREYEMV